MDAAAPLAMVLPMDGSRLLRRVPCPMPALGADQVRLRVLACGVCRTDLHIVDGELAAPAALRIPGHEIVGTVVERGPACQHFKLGDRVGVPWLGSTCKTCLCCLTGHENLCERAGFTGWTLDGGYAQYTVAREDYCVAIPPNYTDEQAAPLERIEIAPDGVARHVEQRDELVDRRLAALLQEMQGGLTETVFTLR